MCWPGGVAASPPPSVVCLPPALAELLVSGYALPVAAGPPLGWAAGKLNV